MPHITQHHIQKRKRAHRNKKHSFSKRSSVWFLDRVCTAFAVLMPMTAIPQIHKLYTTQDAGSLSIMMWVLYCIGVIPFLLYGIAHKIPHLVVLNILWMIAQITMIVGIVMYG